MTPSTSLSRRRLLGIAGAATAGGALLDPAWFRSDHRLGTALDPDAWPMARGGPARTGFAPRGPSENVGVAWTAEFESATDGRLGLVVADGRVYAATFRALVALDAADGAAQWTFTPDDGRIGPHPMESPPVVGEGGLFVGGDRGFYALSAAGTPRWRYEADPRPDGTLVVGSTVFLSSDHGDEPLLALDSDSGVPRWSRKATPVLPQAFADGIVVGAGHEGWDADVGAVDARTGQTHWTRSFDEKSLGTPMPTIVGDTVVYGAETLYALSLADGSTRWSLPLGADDTGGHVSDGDGLYTVVGESVFALDVTTGDHRWRRTLSEGDSRCTPVVTDDTLYAAVGRGVVGLDTETGAERFRLALDSTPSALALAGGTLYAIGGRDVTAVREGEA